MSIGRKADYLKEISKTIENKGYAKVRDISRALNVGFSAVTEMFQKLDKDGYINYERYSGVTLTKKGRKEADRILKRYEILKNFLIILGVNKKTAENDASNFEHVANPNTMIKLTKFVHFFQGIETPMWIDCFQNYCKTGQLPKCPPHESIKCKRLG